MSNVNLRDLWYDWLGLNTWLFKQVNSLSDDKFYNGLMKFLSLFGDKEFLPFTGGAIVIWAAISILIKFSSERSSSKYYLLAWFNVFMVLGGALYVGHYTVSNMKKYFAYPRPYVAIPTEEMKQIEKPPVEDARESFPSGHATLITILVVALWPILSENLRWIGIFSIIGVCWSRMALGVHYPMDVLSGFTIALILTLSVRYVLFTFYGIVSEISYRLFSAR